MRLLIIGGTRFVGLHIAQASLAAGHDVTLFHRGKTAAHGLQGAHEVLGDRRTDLHRVGDGTWDAVLDTCAYLPFEAEIAARYFASRAARYAFISTISVYAPEGLSAIDEDSPVQALPDGADRTRMVPQTYGALKVLCERIAQSTFRHRATIVRPHLVAGPYDPTGRFTYWPLTVAKGGMITAPESPQIPLQYIDARDLAEFALRLVHDDRGGVYNACTTPDSHTFGELLAACERAAGVRAEVRYENAQALLERGVQPWVDLPLWLPSTDAAAHAMLHASNARARTAGLTLRSIETTVRDTLAWSRRAQRSPEFL